MPTVLEKNNCKEKLKVHPIVKWAGGKRQIISVIKENLPTQFNRYFEPFIGGGAVFFEIQPENAYISDTNEELINLYLVVKNNPEELITDLHKHKNSKEYFLKIRNADRDDNYKEWSNIQKASRFIYLNRTCFNGLYRVNSKGQFNVPFGNYSNPKIVDEKNILNCSEILQSTEIRCANFTEILEHIKKGDFVYFDPPYLPLNKSSNFTSYTKEGFDIGMQFRLKAVCDELDKKGVKFLLSNSDTEVINGLYASYNIKKVFASRNINSNSNGRGKITEVLIRNY
ncbi:DNA adenine methylase [Thermodesulfobium acidiphilum]|uniref:Site-specific DNA-methyltransferase (adenine-specific) n=1 Tax=Thermodesulfobium acidiphilum TaxID=1794699 RepID=A0A2R4W1V3_THEAF|nr:DNA adenine methylase [Thermodesulfobium acidiphilum]AWB10783.1 DNA adenine methylase [Thermodesulfobium acidiphilum]